MKYYERLVESIDVDNVKTSVWDDLRSFMAKHRLLEVDSMRKMSDESTEDYVGKITSVVEKTVSDVAAADLNSSYRSANCWGDLKAFEDRRNTSAHLGHPEEGPLLANTWGCAFDSLPKAEEREGRNMKKQRRRRRRSRSRSKIRPEDASSDVEASPIKAKMFLQANDAFDLANNGSEKTEEIPQAEDYDAGSLHFAFGEDMFIGNSETCVDYVDLDDDAVSVSSAGSSFLDLFYQAARERASIDPFGSFTKSSEYILSVGMLGLDPVTAGPTPTAMDTIQQLFDILSTPRFDEPATLPTSVVDEPPTLPSTVDKPPALPPSEEAKSVLPSGPTLPTRMVDEPPTLPSTVDKPPALPFSEEAEIVLPSGEVKKVDRSLDKNNLIEECSSSFDTAPETGNSEDGEPERERVKTIRFADERGLPMETVYMLGGPDDPAAVGRVVVLLLKPDVRKFEFIYAEYRLNSKTSVSNLLKQLPGMASSEILTAQTYSSLFRSREGCSELIGALSLQDCCLDKNEVIIGVIGGYSGQEIVKCALPLIYNDKISKTVSSFRLMQPIHTCDTYKLTCCVLSLSLGETCQTNRPWPKVHPIRPGIRGRERERKEAIGTATAKSCPLCCHGCYVRGIQQGLSGTFADESSWHICGFSLQGIGDCLQFRACRLYRKRQGAPRDGAATSCGFGGDDRYLVLAIHDSIA
jgi:hypothetical protein